MEQKKSIATIIEDKYYVFQASNRMIVKICKYKREQIVNSEFLTIYLCIFNTVYTTT